ncbi:hypothetical protein CVT26_006491 [Gymnopilus dilepis]|uniref:Uncharacterized protein n=1 Tax=Gymnopilus dilepis TaxID=231916 RepID=A0A409W6D1_9AGAR|nr:hypothetical protein CVT26_006491 [Gymnopilus dilepis]
MLGNLRSLWPQGLIIFALVMPLLLDVVRKAELTLVASKSQGRTSVHELQLVEISPPRLAVAFGWDDKSYILTSDSAWKSLLPHNKGINPGSQHGDNMQVALYQQLGCLDAIRLSLLNLYNMTADDQSQPPDFSKTEACFGTIRQALLCSADITLEKPERFIPATNDTPPSLYITGLGILHRCTNWQALHSLI